MDASDLSSTGVIGGSAATPQVARPLRRRVCRVCGQHHASHEPHVYDYVDEVDEDVTCHICLQPLVTPVDTPCGHTFCKPCLLAFLKVQQSCPIDRKPLAQQLCSFSSLVLKKLLEKLTVKCPNTEFCNVTLQRGDLEDHLKYRCPGNWVSCSFSTAGCTFRGPQRSMTSHIATCGFKDQGVSRTPIVEGEVSFIEIPRTQTALGVAIVGGADTPLRCVVIQEVFPDGLIAQDGRLQAGDQIIEIEGSDMTNATHHQVCTALRRTPPVLRLGIYRERVDAYRTNFAFSTPDRISNPSSPVNVPRSPPTVPVSSPLTEQQKFAESESMPYGVTNENGSARESPKQDDIQDELVHVTLMREVGRQLGIKLVGRRTEPGIFIMELMAGSVADQDGRLHPNDRILAINGGDVRYSRLDHAFRLIKQSQGHVSLIVSRSPFKGEYDHLFKKPHPDLVVTHSRTKSAPDRLVEQKRDQNSREFNNSFGNSKDMSEGGGNDRSASCESLDDRSNQSGVGSRFHSNGSLISHSKYSNGNSLGSFTEFEVMNKSNNCSLGSLTSGLNKSSRSLTSPISQFVIDEYDEGNQIPPALPPRSRQPLNQNHSFDHLNDSELSNESATAVAEEPPKEAKGVTVLPASGCADLVEGPGHVSRAGKVRRLRDCSDLTDLSAIMRKSLRIEGSQLHQKTVTISKGASESLGMRIGGGVSSNEGDIPIYIANIHPQGPVWKSKKVKKGDILLSVNGNSLLGLTHTQSVALLKATAELAGVTLSLLEGSETHSGPANFVPSWLYWQRLPRSLHISKNVVLHRPPGASLGFSIVGGSDPQRGPEPIHVLFVVSTSPAAVDGPLRCGDRLLAVDGHCLENVSHATAVNLLKQAGQRVTLEVVSWMGTEL